MRLVGIAVCALAAVFLVTMPQADASRGGIAAPAPMGALGAVPPAPPGALAQGLLPESQSLRLSVTLRLPEPGAVTAFIAGVSNRQSTLFHHFLTPGQFGPRFGPSLAEVDAVLAALRAVGLQPGMPATNRLSIPLVARAASVESAFQVVLENYRLRSGRTAYSNLEAPRLPAAVAPLVQGVVGLSDLYNLQPLVAHPVVGQASERASSLPPQSGGPGPQPCATVTTMASGDGAYTEAEISSHYGMWPLYSLGDFGQGVHVALVEFEPNLPSDIAAFQTCYGTNTTVNYFSVNGGVGTGAGSGEAAADIENIIGLAPQVTIDVYQASQSGSGDYQDYSTIINNDHDQVISTSWGACEPLDASALQSEQDLFAQAATQGQTILAAAGDTGSTGCFDQTGPPDSSQLWVEDPASQPYVVGVGGTSLAPSGAETVWNDSANDGGAGGGGLSQAWCMPSYQDLAAIPGLISSYSRTNSQCPAPGYVRQVPDVSADADPYTGYLIYWNAQWIQIGGTSLAAPLWASVAPLIDASPFCSGFGAGDPGALPQGLYDIASTSYYGNAFNDITSGNNDYSPSGYKGGLYPATYGYNLASGLGTPQVMDYTSAGAPSYFDPGLAALQCFAYRSASYADTITAVTPDAASESASTTITIDGTGFMPLTGADVVTYGNHQVAANCSSTTVCTAVLPASQVQETVDLRMVVEDLVESGTTTADQFSWSGPYPNPPTNLQGAPSPGAVALSWTPPAYSGTSAITSYTVAGSNLTSNSALTPVSVSGNPPSTQAVITGLTSGDIYSFTVAATNATGTGAPSTPFQMVAPARYDPLTPARICDTRPTYETGAPADQCTGETLGAGQSITVQVTGYGGVPSTASAVVANVTVTNTTAASFLTVWPAGASQPLASNLNWTAGQTVANLVTVPLSASGAIQLYNLGGLADVVVDVEGYYGPATSSLPGLGFTPLPPARICDTRPVSQTGVPADQCTGETLGAGQSITVQVTGYGVPNTATAVVANVTVTNTTAASFLTVWPAGASQPLASNLNWTAGETRPNRVIVPLSATGQIQVFNYGGAADVVIDVNGYYSASSPGLFEPISPVRICDTRPISETGAAADQCTGHTLTAGTTLPVQVAGAGGLPGAATAVVANVTVTNTTAPSFLTVYAGADQPLASDLNWVGGETVPNMVIAMLSSAGGLEVYNRNGQADVVVDVEGWFT